MRGNLLICEFGYLKQKLICGTFAISAMKVLKKGNASIFEIGYPN